MRRCIYHRDLGQNAEFHNFSREIALRTINRGLLAKPFKYSPKSPVRPACSAGSLLTSAKFAVRAAVECLNEHYWSYASK